MQSFDSESKQERKLRKALLRAEKNKQRPYQEEKFTVLCVRFGPKYSRDYVEKLRNMVQRNVTVPYEFVCITDDSRPIDGVRLIVQPFQNYRKIWWHKIHMFDSSLPLYGRILYFDLDVIICNNINKLLIDHENKFLGIKDFNRKFHNNWQYLNSSVMSWLHGSQHQIYQQFKNNSVDAQRLQGDQDWIWKLCKTQITFWPTEWIMSYKWEIRNREELVNRTGKQGFKTIAHPNIPRECSVAVFHGDPKPQDVHDPFVIDHWR